MLNVAPPIVKVPERLGVPVFAATAKSTVPLPEPAAPPVIVIQVRLLDAVQAQPAAVVTVLLPVPAVDENDWLVGEIEYAQPAD
jgi:hypothetical protein